jgi:arylsulfatase A-like enzyme
MAIAFGLAAGYLDLVIIVLKKYCWNDMRDFGSGRDFPWSVPLGHAVLLGSLGVLLAVLGRLRPRTLSLRAGTWLFATLAIWGALLRMPLYGLSSLLLAAGLGRLISVGIAARDGRPWRARSTLAGLLGVLVILAAGSSGWQAIREHRAGAGLPAPPANARNAVLIVWDTVRALNLSLHDYPRDTTPNLVRWARKGVRFSLPLAPAPWTYPSHSCFFTGRWPLQVNSQWKYHLDAPVPTLAEYLASRGYQTAGFSANTACCSYETGLDRGFTHYEDFPMTPRSLLSRTVPGNWILQNLFNRGDFHQQKWIRLQSRDARGINASFRDWLRGRRRDRPFFAFLNYFDAHDPYVPPAEFAGRFGMRPTTSRDYQLLVDLAQTKDLVAVRDVVMARDCYDDCIAFLDDQLGRLLEELEDQGLLDSTVVIITSDHGEAFGNHGVFGHGGSLHLDQVAVPLVILAPGAPAGRVVDQAVSLCDLPATVVDQLGLSAGSPFPGHSLAALWRSTPGRSPPAITPAFSEMAQAVAFQAQPQGRPSRQGLQMSLVALGRHYLRDGRGTEQLFDLGRDPFETVNLMGSAEGNRDVGLFRRMLLQVLNDNPGSIEVETAYLKAYRQSLASLVEESPTARAPISAQEALSNTTRE